MTEPTDYERGLRDGVEIGKRRRLWDVLWWACLGAGAGCILALAFLLGKAS